MMMLFVLTLTVFLVVTVGMAIGYLVRGQCLRGSCGGDSVWGPDGELLLCDHCPKRKEYEDAAADS